MMNQIIFLLLIITATSVDSFSLAGKVCLPRHSSPSSKALPCSPVGSSSGGGVVSEKTDLSEALEVLKRYDSEYLQLLKEARKDGKPIAVLQLQRAQTLKADGIKAEREALRTAVLTVTKECEYVTLGIMAETGERAVKTLKAWVSSLELPRGILRAVEETSSDEIEITSLDNIPVYLKYGPAKSGDAYMKAYGGGNVGVIFQPKLKNQSDEVFYQFGDLPLSTFI